MRFGFSQRTVWHFQEHTKVEMDAWKIVRVSEDFRVIALGLPVPKYKGNPLDPPLRSRFQARDIYYLPFKVRAQPSSDQHSLPLLLLLLCQKNKDYFQEESLP